METSPVGPNGKTLAPNECPDPRNVVHIEIGGNQMATGRQTRPDLGQETAQIVNVLQQATTDDEFELLKIGGKRLPIEVALVEGEVERAGWCDKITTDVPHSGT